VIREVERLSARTYDVLVVGGGIYGLAIAYDAAQRGLTVALVERDDFGSGSSFNHHRTIHGGLRYLQHLDVRRARESVRERRTIAQIAPQTVKPLAFAVPLYRSLLRGKWAMRAGFLLDRLVAINRNSGVPITHRLPAGRVISRGRAIQEFPGLKRQGLTGAAVFWDYVTVEPDRLTFAFARGAAEHGAALANHVEAVEPRVSGRRVVGVVARDRLSGKTIEVAAMLTVNATGSQVDHLLAPLQIPSGIPMLKAMNLVTYRDAGDVALGGRSPSGRNLFLVPWRDRAMFGTWESSSAIEPGDTGVHEADVLAFMAELNDAYPALDLSMKDIALVHRGVVPAVVRHGKASLEGRDLVIDHAERGVDGLISAIGTKYTTARAVAQRVTDRILVKLKKPAVSCRTNVVPLPGGSIRDVGNVIADARREHDQGLPADTIPHLIAAYGSRYREVLHLADGHADWRAAVDHGSPVIGAQLVWAVRKEMAVTLADVILRRTPFGAAGYPGDAGVERAATIVGSELGWDADRRRREIDEVRAFYGSVNALKT
jgi:glycerol-3-phosphate dehydrogenase